MRSALPWKIEARTGRAGRVVSCLPAAVVLLVASAACGDQSTAQWAQSQESLIYEAALQELFEELGRPLQDLVIPDRFITIESPNETEAATPGVARGLAQRYPSSRVCEYDVCDPAVGETYLMVSKVRMLGEREAEVAILMSLYVEGDDFYGDGFMVRLTREGTDWSAVGFERTYQH